MKLDLREKNRLKLKIMMVVVMFIGLFFFCVGFFGVFNTNGVPPHPDEVSSNHNSSIGYYLDDYIEIPYTLIDAGLVGFESLSEQSFFITNCSEDILSLKLLETSCTCTKAVVSPEKLKPGETGEVKLVFDSTGKIGINQIRTVLETSNPHNKKISLSAKFDVNYPTHTIPLAIDHGTIGFGDVVQGCFKVLGHDLMDTDIDQVESDSLWLEYTKKKKMDDNTYLVSYIITPTNSGPQNAKLKVVFSNGENVFFPVSVLIRSPEEEGLGGVDEKEG